MKTCLCPECGRELEPGQKCPECGKTGKLWDLLAEEAERQRKLAEARQKYGDKARLFKV